MDAFFIKTYLSLYQVRIKPIETLEMNLRMFIVSSDRKYTSIHKMWNLKKNDLNIAILSYSKNTPLKIKLKVFEKMTLPRLHLKYKSYTFVNDLTNYITEILLMFILF